MLGFLCTLFFLCVWPPTPAMAASAPNPILRSAHVGAVRDAFFLNEFSPWNGVLNLVYSEALSLGAKSAQPRDYLIKLADGVSGSFADFPGSFLLFDGSLAQVQLKLPAWQRVENLSFQAIEWEGQVSATVKLEFVNRSGRRRACSMAREVTGRKGAAVLARYRTRCDGGVSDGLLTLEYDNHALEYVFLDELVVDGLGSSSAAALPPITDFEGWKKLASKSEFERIARELASGSPQEAALLKVLLGHPTGPRAPSRLIFMKTQRAQGLKIHSFLLQVDQTGLPTVDVARGFLVTPDRPGSAPLPLVVLNHQGSNFGAEEPLGFMGRQELGLAEELAEHGVASLALDMVWNNGLPGNNPTAAALYSHHPHWSMTGKETDNLRRALDTVLEPGFARRIGAAFDSRRIGAFGFSYGAFNTLLGALDDPRYRFVAMSHLENYSKDWLNFADALYIPQLDYFRKAPEFPLHVCALVKAISARRVLVTTGEEALARHYDSCLPAGQDRIRVAVNPLGKFFSYPERQATLNFLLENAGVSGRARAYGVRGRVGVSTAPFVARKNAWRNLLIEKLRSPERKPE